MTGAVLTGGGEQGMLIDQYTQKLFWKMVENRNIFIATLVNDNASRSLKYESAEPGEVSDQTGVEQCPEYSQG